ncbi:MAG: tetratricopeptide repeat protein [Anaerobacillus sp.]|uniref:tetratricopeptide repeat protein n=1 Tax=Anaerobacillus sp. TaxID=1872506 RepID=UPI00391AF61D
MIEDQFLLYDHKKPIRLEVERVSLYLQGQIIEAFTEKKEVYYLFFYKYNFLTAFKTTKLRRHSFIEHAFTKGFVFTHPHPFINALFSANHPCQMVNVKSLLSKLEKRYTPHEKAFILTFFESFIPKKQLFTEIQSTFYEYRRNGQMFLGYQIVRVLMDFAPKNSWVKPLASDRSFTKYTEMYSENSGTLFSKDLIFSEKTLYAKKQDERCFEQLVGHYENENRWIDLIALYLEKLTLTPKTNYYIPLKQLLKQHLSEGDSLMILENLSNDIPSFQPLQQDLFSIYIDNEKIDAVLKMMNNPEFKLNNKQIELLGETLEQLDVSVHSLEPKMLNVLLNGVINLFPDRAEQLLTKYVVSLLKTHEITYIKTWLELFKENEQSRQLFEKLVTIERLNDDLDQMQTLGELYYEFKQWDKALECFSWEMELNPNECKPLQWLAKVYREKGMKHEADAYHQLCINLQKHA